MASIMKVRAGVRKIVPYAMATMTAAVARGGNIEAAAKDRLGQGMANAKQAEAQRDATEAAKQAALQTLKVEQEKAKGTIGAVKDEMWNRLGRPHQSDFIDQAFPDGVATYTDGDVRDLPVRMKILLAHVASTPAPALDAGREDWAKRLTDSRGSLAAAVEVYREAAAEAAVAASAYGAVARALVVGLNNFKRDLLTMGLTEQKVHDIIPDASRPARTTGEATPPAPPTSPGKPAGNDNQTPPAPPTHAAG